ncbi:hypothetical protein T484DRAFT_1926301 [Baffinella frigidus]|nr:hypothetical protein T484DRAFT_1926301 [Cryptophyta sp. CCMP2293]
MMIFDAFARGVRRASQEHVEYFGRVHLTTTEWIQGVQRKALPIEIMEEAREEAPTADLTKPKDREKALKADIETLWALYQTARVSGHVVDAPWVAEPKHSVEEEEAEKMERSQITYASSADTILRACSSSPSDDAARQEGGGEDLRAETASPAETAAECLEGEQTKSKPFKGLRGKLSALQNALSMSPRGAQRQSLPVTDDSHLGGAKMLA